MKVYEIGLIRKFYIDRDNHGIYIGGEKIVDTAHDYMYFLEALKLFNDYLIFRKNVEQSVEFTNFVEQEHHTKDDYCEEKKPKLINIFLKIVKKENNKSLLIKIDEKSYFIEEPDLNIGVSLLEKFINHKSNICPFREIRTDFEDPRFLESIGEIKVIKESRDEECNYV